MFKTDRKSTAFRRLVQDRDATIIKVPAKTFADTDIETRIVKIRN